MIAVTSFSKSGYETYGKKMIESMIHHWPTKLIIYSEFPLEPIQTTFEKVEIRNLFDIPNIVTFLQYIKNIPLAHGNLPEGYNYNFNLWKFSRKIFAQYDVLKDYSGKVFWVDADCYVRKPVPVDFLDSLFEGHPLAYLGREGFYTETGFIGFDSTRPRFKEFLENYIGCLRKGKIFELKRWHDCEAFDWAREQTGIQDKNLSPFFKIPDDKKMSLVDLDVVYRSVLSEYLTHFKGKRKDIYAD